MLHISIKAEKITEIFGFPISNSLLSTYILIILFFIFSLLYSSRLGAKGSKFVFIVRFINNGIFSLFQSIMKEKIFVFFPLLASFFLFILFSNWLGLIPGVGSIIIKHQEETIPLLRGATADLNTTLALAIISVVLIQYYGIRYLGLAGYFFKKIYQFKQPNHLLYWTPRNCFRIF